MGFCEECEWTDAGQWPVSKIRQTRMEAPAVISCVGMRACAGLVWRPMRRGIGSGKKRSASLIINWAQRSKESSETNSTKGKLLLQGSLDI